MLLRRALIALAWVLVPGPVAAQEATLEYVLARYYEAVGGVEAWESIRSMRVSGTMTMGRGMVVPFTRLLKRPDKIRMEFTMQGMTGIRASDGRTAWMLMPFRGRSEPEVLGGNMARGLMREADIGGPLINYQQKGHTIELLGLVETDGTEAYKLEVTLKTGNVQFYFMDAEYFLPIKTLGRRSMRGNEVEVETVISDYKSVDGVMMAHSFQTAGMQGRGGQALTIETIELNVEIDDSAFAMPKQDGGT